MIDYREQFAPKCFWDVAKENLKFAQHQGLSLTQGTPFLGEALVRGHIFNCINLPPKSAGAKMYLRTCMPYVIQDGICLNREYKPVGLGGKSFKDWVDYDIFRETHSVSCDDDEPIWFYHDGNAPWYGGAYHKNYFYRVIHRFYPIILEDI